MRAVFAGDIADLATDAQFGMNLGDDLVIEVEISPALHVGHGAPAEILDAPEAMVVHVLREPSLMSSTMRKP